VSLARLGLAVALVVVPALGCSDGSGAGPDSADGQLRVVATTTQTADFARVVGGERVQVYGVLKPNVDPHDFDPSPADLDALGRADVIVRNGVGLEDWFADVIRSAEADGAVVDASAGVPLRRSGSDGDGADDPHIWHNPRYAMRMVTNIESAFSAADPPGDAAYRENAQRYVGTLETLDAEIETQTGALPNRKLVTNHDAFGYFVDRYRFEFVGSIIPTFDTQAELSGRDVSDLVARIRDTGVKAVFSESSLPPRTAESIGREAGVRVVAGEEALYGDTLGPPGSDGATYPEMMRHNARVIVDGLR
jgi:ABC-type Zn uptake system ZnuABC Zn-binding protein ZnuA